MSSGQSIYISLSAWEKDIGILIVYNNYKSEVVQQNKRLIGFLQHQFIRFGCINGRVVCVRPAVVTRNIDDQ